ncbi:hypothetical protein H4R34_001720 [Dimargaris verticillata]|uniref:CRIB domain-containing protein n=1 Tax=Dimargaris verticillata TaxID=2761393 RepID=A0A9W8B446_9FUNG|nr:hypothetical protein H4R34_001720 [Dimargaris verticillata]
MPLSSLFTSCLGFENGYDQQVYGNQRSTKRKRSNLRQRQDIRKLVISGPSDFRHTTHCGLDNMNFGQLYEGITNATTGLMVDTPKSSPLYTSPSLHPCKRISVCPEASVAVYPEPVASHLLHGAQQPPVRMC